MVSQRVSEAEIEWMLRQRPLIHDPEQLVVDYGGEAAEMIDALSGEHAELLPLLAWPGVATRWRRFLQWARESRPEGDARLVFTAYARELGRLTTYRALALTDDQFHQLKAADTILSSGRLKADAATVDASLREQGLRSVLDARMRKIGTLRYDPSLSVHDHPETAVCIASGYLTPPERRVYRFELDVPRIEVIGWRMCEVNGWVGWFSHQGVWFDPTNPRTERFMLWEIPFLEERCRSVRIFDAANEIADYVREFRAEQARARELALAVGPSRHAPLP